MCWHWDFYETLVMWLQSTFLYFTLTGRLHCFLTGFCFCFFFKDLLRSSLHCLLGHLRAVTEAQEVQNGKGGHEISLWLLGLTCLGNSLIFRYLIIYMLTTTVLVLVVVNLTAIMHWFQKCSWLELVFCSYSMNSPHLLCPFSLNHNHGNWKDIISHYPVIT